MFQRIWRLAKAIGQSFLKSGRSEPETAPNSDFVFSAEIQRTPDPISSDAQARYDEKADTSPLFRKAGMPPETASREFHAFRDRRDSTDEGDPFDIGRERIPPGGYSPERQRQIDVGQAVQRERMRRILNGRAPD